MNNKAKPPIGQWACNNKTHIALVLLSLSLFVSTVALSVQIKKSSETKCDQKDKIFIDHRPASKNKTSEDVNHDYRLPRHILPKNYKLQLRPNFANKTFRGSAEITLDILQPTRNVILHANKLTIISTSLNNSLYYLPVTTETSNDKRNLLIIKAQDNIKNGVYTLKMNFTGLLDGIVGFYASSLKNGGTCSKASIEMGREEVWECFSGNSLTTIYQENIELMNG